DVLARIGGLLAQVDGIATFPILFGNPPVLKLMRPRPVGWWFNLKMGMSHQSCLIPRSLFAKIGNYDPRFRITMDYELLMRALRSGTHIYTFDEPALAVMRDSGISSQRNWLSISTRLAEERRVHELHAPRWSLPIYY